MSLHHRHGDVEEDELFSISPSSDVQHTSHIELVESLLYNNARPSSPAMIAINLKKSTSNGNLYEKLWAHVGSLFVDWSARLRSLFVDWSARAINFYMDWWARVVILFVDWWIGELLAILLSMIALSAIICVLYMYDGHHQPTLPHNVSLNFIISTLATVSKSSLLFAVASALGQYKWLWMFSKQRRLRDLQVFDDASRGPLGASRLLASRSLSWASIGAVVTILSLIYDPFIQGLIKVSERLVYKNNPAALVNRLEKFPFYEMNYLMFDYTLINTISNAAFNPNTLSETQPRCPTGNCTWPSFTSLGFCFKCQNISQSVQDSSTYVIEQEIPEDEWPPDSLAPELVLWRTYIYKFPELNGQVLKADSFKLDDQRSFSTRFDMAIDQDPRFFVFRLFWDPVTPFNFSDGTSVPTVSLLILIRTSTAKSNPGSVLAADLCALSFCAQKRTVSVSLNQLSSTVLQTVYGTRYMHFTPKQKDEASEYGPKEGLLFTGDDFNMTFSDMQDGFGSQIWEENLRLLLSTFEGNLTGMPGAIEIPVATSNVIGAFNASSNISMTMNNIATAMTNYFRDSSNETVIGQAGQIELYVHVNWPWITLPVVLVLAGTTFLLLTIFETKRLGASVWKTSELALLFHGSEESYPDVNASGQSSEMDNVAAGIKAKMAKTSSGKWILRREDPRI